jgi:hypothetical protein
MQAPQQQTCMLPWGQLSMGQLFGLLLLRLAGNTGVAVECLLALVTETVDKVSNGLLQRLKTLISRPDLNLLLCCCCTAGAPNHWR